MNTIAIDCGASFIKGAIFDNGHIKKILQKHAPIVHKSENIREPTQINAILVTVREILTELIGNEKEVRLCISNEMHGFILTDQNANPFIDYISWQKEYGFIEVKKTTAFQEISASTFEQDILNSGMPLRAGLPSVNLLYLILADILNTSSELYFFTLGDYILRILSGKEVYCHPTNAAATGLYDITTSNWNKNLLSLIAGQHITFPKIGESETSFELNGVLIHTLPALGDQQAALYGAELHSENTLSFNLGTGSQVSIVEKNYNLSNEYQTRPYFNGLYLKTIPHLPSGRAMNVYIRFLKDILYSYGEEKNDEEIWKVIFDKVDDAPETNMKFDMSFFSNPITKKLKGSIEDIGEYDLTLGTMFKGIFKQMSSNYIWAANKIIPDKSKIKLIIFSGGVAQKNNQIRKGILENYQGVPSIVSDKDTLYGLYKYGNSNFIQINN